MLNDPQKKLQVSDGLSHRNLSNTDFFIRRAAKQPTLQTKNIQKLYLRILGKHDTMLVPGKVQYLYFVDMIKQYKTSLQNHVSWESFMWSTLKCLVPSQNCIGLCRMHQMHQLWKSSWHFYVCMWNPMQNQAYQLSSSSIWSWIHLN